MQADGLSPPRTPDGRPLIANTSRSSSRLSLLKSDIGVEVQADIGGLSTDMDVSGYVLGSQCGFKSCAPMLGTSLRLKHEVPSVIACVLPVREREISSMPVGVLAFVDTE